MLATLDDLSPSQLLAVGHAGGPLLVHGPAGTGKTHCLLLRACRLAAVESDGTGTSLLLALSVGEGAELRRRLEGLSALRPGASPVAGRRPAAGAREPQVLTAAALCERLLRDEALEAGLDPFFVTATRADRVALLLERLEELPLGGSDLQGRPARLMARLVERIDLLKQQLVGADRFIARARRLADEHPGSEADRELDFAELYLEHDRLLAERATPDAGELLIRACALLRERPSVRERLAERFPQVLLDDWQAASPAVAALVGLLGSARDGLTLAADERLASWPPERGATSDGLAAAAPSPVARFREQHPDGTVVELVHNRRSAAAIVGAAEALLGDSELYERPPADGREQAEAVELWRPANERAQAQGVAADIERLIAREGIDADRVAVLLGGDGAAGQPMSGHPPWRGTGRQGVVGALEERAIAHRVLGATILFQHAEVRDVLAWMRLLIDPRDSAAVLRVLARAPIELRQVDLARVVQIARRRKLDMVSALAAAIESPQIPPEARERIQVFLRLHRETAAELDTIRPDIFVHRLIERVGLRRQRLFAAHADVVEGLIALARLGELAAAFVQRAPQSGSRELAEYLAATSEAGLSVQEGVVEERRDAVQVMDLASARGREFEHVYVLGCDGAPAELYLAMTRARRRLVLSCPARTREGARHGPSLELERVRLALGADWVEREEELFGPAEALHATLRLTRAQLLADVTSVAGRLGELRLDTELDIAHGVARYLELIKLAALIERPAELSIADVLPDINARLLSAATAVQAEILASSELDDDLLAVDRQQLSRHGVPAPRHGGPLRRPGSPGEPSLERFLPRRGEGLLLSASDIETYRGCPLRYKFARVFRIPAEPTLNQRFGIVVHQVLERYHAGEPRTLAQMLELLDAGWRRSGLGDGEQERQLLRKARASLTRYHERLRATAGAAQQAEPVWFERSFSFALGPHQLRGRVDRVDRLPDGEHELIDYKTGLPRSVHQLRHDIQLSLYALAAREAWQLQRTRQSYYYVLDDRKVQLPAPDADWIADTVLEVGAAILEQDFEPTPSLAACSICDYRIMCPAAEI